MPDVGSGQTPTRRNPVFDVAPRNGYWTRQGRWINSPGRQADVYVFAWHGRDGEDVDHIDPLQWRFFVVAERDLPQDQTSSGFRRLMEIAAP